MSFYYQIFKNPQLEDKFETLGGAETNYFSVLNI